MRREYERRVFLGGEWERGGSGLNLVRKKGIKLQD